MSLAGPRSRLFALIAAIWLTACHGSSTPIPVLARQTFLPVKPDDFSGLAWPTEEGLIVGTQTPFRATAVFDLSLVSMAGTVSRLPLPKDHACDVFEFGPKYNITDYQFPTLLPDGRVAIRRSCRATDAPPQIIAFDPRTSAEEVMWESPTPFGQPGPSFWNPNLTRGISAISSGICGTVVWLTAGGVEGVPLWIEGGGIRWRLDSGLRGNASGDCNDQGRADWPAWSPDGKLIAFFGSPESTGQRDFARLDVPFHLYLMDAGELEPRVVMDDLLEPRSPVWSPDSKLLAFSVIRGPNRGVWLYEPAAERRIRVSRDKISWLAWSPKGNELAAITDEFDAETAKSHNRIVILDVTAPVG